MERARLAALVNFPAGADISRARQGCQQRHRGIWRGCYVTHLRYVTFLRMADELAKAPERAQSIAW